MLSIQNDFAYVLRSLRKAPGFVAGTTLTLGLVIAANAVFFSLLDALMFRPLPVHEPQQLVQLIARSSNENMPDPFPWSYPDFESYTEASDEIFSGISIFAPRGFVLRGTDRTITARGANVSGDFFHVFGLNAMLGRTFTMNDDSVDNPGNVVVLNETFWLDKFGGDSNIIGNQLYLDDHAFTVVGIVDGGEAFHALRQPDLFVPTQAVAQISPGNPLSSRDSYWISAVFARLRPDIPIRQAQALVKLQSERLASTYQEFRQHNLHVTMERSNTYASLLRQDRTAHIRLALMLWTVTLLLVVVGCLNVMNLVLARRLRNLRQTAVQAALGATRARLTGSLVAESSVITFIGAGIGCILAVAGLRLAGNFPALAALQPALDGRVLMYVLSVAVLMSLVIGLMPLLTTGLKDLSKHLRDHQPVPARAQHKLRHVLLVGQIAATTMLIIGVGLVSRSLIELDRVDLGFDSGRIAVAEVDFSEVTGSRSEAPSYNVLEVIRDTIIAVPGIESLSFADKTPLDQVSMTTRITALGSSIENASNLPVGFATVADDYFEVLGARIIDGLSFSSISPSLENVVLINRTMAEWIWPDENVIGRRFTVNDQTLEVIGVVSDLSETDPSADPTPFFYYRFPSQAGSFVQIVMNLAKPQATGQLRTFEQAISSSVPGVAIHAVELMDDRVQSFMQTRRGLAWILGSFASISLLIALVGIFAVMSYSITLRQHEIGVRMAVGASVPDVFKLLARYMAGLACTGLFAGLIGAAALSHLIGEYVYGVSTLDPATYIGAAVLICTFALIAGMLPGITAARINPARILQQG